MTRLFKNAHIKIQDMDGNIKIADQFVQLDDFRPTIEKKIDSIPLIEKVVYDFPNTPFRYSRGDVVTLLSIGGHAVIPEDNLFYVMRALEPGSPLPAWEVSLIGGRITDVTISNVWRVNPKTKQKISQPTNLQPLRVTYIPPTMEKMFGYGDALDSYLIADPQQDWQVGDIFTVLKIDGHSSVDKVTEYGVKLVSRFPTPVPHIHIRFTGALQ